MSRPLLVTIPFSHFCEKARWGLRYARVEFDEEGHLPIFHVRAVRRRGGARTVPALCTADGVIGDSTEILLWADRQAPADRRLYPAEGAAREEVLALEESFDTRLGVDTRRWAYSFILRSRELLLAVADFQVPRWEARALPWVLPVARALMTRAMRIYPPQVERSRVEIHRTFDAIGERLADGRRYLVGDRLSAADITFASLAAPALVPAEYYAPMPALDRLPPAIQAEIAGLRDHPAGRFALRLYAEERAC